MYGAFESPSTLDFEWFSSMITKMCAAGVAGFGFLCGFGFAPAADTTTNMSAATSSAPRARFFMGPPSLTGRRPTRLGPGPNSVVHSPLGPQRLADLAHRAARAEGLTHDREQICVAAGCLPHCVEGRSEERRVGKECRSRVARYH